MLAVVVPGVGGFVQPAISNSKAPGSGDVPLTFPLISVATLTLAPVPLIDVVVG